jgi:glycosyltransferase involved in cell wall biosynthesis
MDKVNGLTVGIDATNLRRGGGVTHLVELLRAAMPHEFNIARVVVWGGTPTLKALEDRPWLIKRYPAALDKGLLQRLAWQRWSLSKAAYDEGCDVLFVPGGSYAGSFRPVVTMSRNLLPFEWRELRRYGWTLLSLKLLLLRLTQTRSFRKSDGVIFLTEYARDVVLQHTGTLHGRICIVPHGLNSRFNTAPKVQRHIAHYDDACPYRVLYVSIIDQYKHQWHVVEAVAALRQQGLPLALDLVGPAYAPAMQRLKEALNDMDAERAWVNYHGAIEFAKLHCEYARADLAVFASSCENMPNILLETMASGLPLACSNRGPMPEILGDSGVYFDPERAADIARALRSLIESADLRTRLANEAFERAQAFSWKRCASETFAFLEALANARTANSGARAKPLIESPHL